MSSLPPGSDRPSFNDWLRIQRALMDAELELANRAEDYVNGDITVEELDKVDQKVKSLRLLNDEVLRRVREGLNRPT
jgi:hypothetical protein